MTPRRSSRARTSQPAPPAHTNSSNSVSSISRPDRSTRSNNKQQSPQRSSAQRSESLGDADSSVQTETTGPRRSRRGNDNEKEGHVQQPGEEGDGDPEGLEEDITRCVCGQAEYPGPPFNVRDSGQRRAGRSSIKDERGDVDDPTASDALSDDIGNFFIQCDKCHVWQHGGCVGLTDESMSPDEYYCEECKPELHRLIRPPNGSKSSRYLPVLEAVYSRSSSMASQDNSRRKDSKSKQQEKEQATKRRATMNSRTAYDEDEMLRRAMKESEEMATLGKRQREDSDENKSAAKRQRTGSSSPSTLSKQSRSPSRAPAELATKASVNGNTNVRKVRGVAARNSREKEARDRQKELAAQRAEAASKRNARSERRRAEGSPPPTPRLSPSKAATQTTNAKAASPDTPSSRANQSNHRKTGKPPVRRGRLGRNQYTRDLPLNGESCGSPSGDNSHGPSGQAGSPAHANGINGESGRSSRPKYHNPTRTSLNEMKRRVAAILEFVNRMQTEKQSQGSSACASEKGSKGSSTPNVAAAAGSAGAPTGTAFVQAVEASLSEQLARVPQKNFAEMPSGEMLESLTKDLIQWQTLYGKYGEK